MTRPADERGLLVTACVCAISKLLGVSVSVSGFGVRDLIAIRRD
jgi:hypothetical protein